MRPVGVIFALLTLGGFVAVMPLAQHYVTDSPGAAALSTEASFLAALVIPAMVALFIGSWLQPGGR